MLRTLLLLLTLIFFASCGLLTVKEPQIEFMGKKQIVEQMTKEKKMIAQGLTIEEDDEFDEDAQIRNELLIPDEIFLIGHKKQSPTLQFVQKSKTPKSKNSFVDLSYRDTPIKSQNGPLCTAWAVVASIENMLNKKENLKWDLSEQHHWSRYEAYNTETSVKTGKKYPIADEEWWPTAGKDRGADDHAHAIIASTKYHDDNIHAVLDSLDRGNVVVMALRTPKDMINCRETIRDGVDQYKGKGGHAVLIVGYEQDDEVTGGYYFKIKNSWGDDCGDKGYQYAPLFDTCTQDGMYCYFHEIVEANSTKLSVDPSTPDQPEGPKYESKCVEWKKKWWPPYCWVTSYTSCYVCKKYEWIKIEN